MVDTLTPAERSERMSKIRGTSTAPEMCVRRYLHGQGLRYRLHSRDLPGRPDLVLPRYKVVIFVHGCFWHAHSCQMGRIPSTRTAFWKDKFETNKARDSRNIRKLRRLGWRVLTVWECGLSTQQSRNRSLPKLLSRIQNEVLCSE